MRKILYLLTIIAFTLSACKKDKVPQRTIDINAVSYNTVLLGSKTWTAVNYRGPGGVDVANNTDYGKVYTLAEARLVDLPKGWRIPSILDYFDLMVLTGAGDPREGYQNMVKSQLVTLMSTTGWSVENGTNTTGFNMFPAGYYLKTATGTSWMEAKNQAVFLTTSTNSVNRNICFAFGLSSTGAVIANLADVFTTPDDRAALRFVKDN